MGRSSSKDHVPNVVDIHSRLTTNFGPRVALPKLSELEQSWEFLFGEPFAKRAEHSNFVVILHCGSSGREHMLAIEWLDRTAGPDRPSNVRPPS